MVLIFVLTVSFLISLLIDGIQEFLNNFFPTVIALDFRIEAEFFSVYQSGD